MVDVRSNRSESIVNLEFRRNESVVNVIIQILEYASVGSSGFDPRPYLLDASVGPCGTSIKGAASTQAQPATRQRPHNNFRRIDDFKA